jgi:hypothetical protein
MKTLAQILASLQANVSDLAAFVAGSVLPPTGTVPQNIAAAMASVQSCMATLTTTAQTAPFDAVNTLAAFSSLQTAVSALGNAIALPSAVTSQLLINPATNQPYNNTAINPATGRPFGQ